jgi:PEP-CTERM motif
MHKKTWLAALATAALMGTAQAAPVTLTGADLLTTPDASFPSVQPKLSDTSLIFEWGTSHGPPLMNLVRYGVNSDGTLQPIGDATISATWNLTRLACIGFCAGGDDGTTQSDWDAHFFLSDGTRMFGFALSDGNNGSLTVLRDADAGSTGVSRVIDGVIEQGFGFPAIGSAVDVNVSFTLHDGSLTGRFQSLGIDRSWTWVDTLSRTTDLALLLAQDNDSGERYQVNYLQFPDTAAVPEPTTVALVGAALLGIAAARRRKPPPGA